MAQSPVHTNKDPYEDDPYKKEDNSYFEQLRQELEKYKDEWNATNSELAEGLGISRQTLIAFLKNSSKGLPITRGSILRCCDLLKKNVEIKKIVGTAKSKREKLNADSLLKTAGFLPTAPILDVETNQIIPTQRFINKLRMLDKKNSFFRVLEAVESSLIDRIFDLEEEIMFGENQSTNKSDVTLSYIDFQDWADRNLSYVDKDIKLKCQKTIEKFIYRGKKKFTNIELFELLSSIQENEINLPAFRKHIRIRVNSCEFNTLSFSLHEMNTEGLIQGQLEQIAKLAEAKISNLEQSPMSSSRETILDPVILASIVCVFKDNKQQSEDSVRWCYSSSSTNVENMLAALENGMGYCAELQMSNLSTHSLGRRDSSLARVLVEFTEAAKIEDNPKNSQLKKYQGIWVDRSIIISKLQSVVIAVQRWLSDQLTTEEQYESYSRVCKQVAEIEEGLLQGRKALNQYVIQGQDQDGKEADNSAIFYLKEKVIKKVDYLLKNELPDTDFKEWYGDNLQCKYNQAILMLARAEHIEGNLTAASKYLEEAENNIDVKKQTHIYWLFYVETLIHELFKGKKNQPLKTSDEILIDLHENYIKQEDLRCRNFADRFDFEAYLSASESCGNIARIAFYFSDFNDLEPGESETIINDFLMAAYYASKIGLKERTAHWLCHAGRTYSRLLDGQKAEQYTNLAEDILLTSIEPRCSLKYREAVLAEVNLAHGERLLLVEKNELALKFFMCCLKGAIYIGFARLIVDSLYGIYRSSIYLGNSRVKDTFHDIFGDQQEFCYDSSGIEKPSFLSLQDKNWKDNKIAADVIDFLDSLDKNAAWSLVAEQFQDQAKQIWNSWANVGVKDGTTKHPFEKAIDDGTFLGALKEVNLNQKTDE